MNPLELFRRVTKVAPGFEAVLKDHLKDNNQLLAHVLMAELLRYVGRTLSSKGPQSQGEVKAVLSLLESALGSGDPETDNAIAVSFIEHIETESFYLAIKPLLGPKMLAEHAQSAR